MMGILEVLEAVEPRRRCVSCHYWQQYPTIQRGECRRHSPLCSENEAHIFPITHSSCWCGDYAAAARSAAGRSAADDKAQEAPDA